MMTTNTKNYNFNYLNKRIYGKMNHFWSCSFSEFCRFFKYIFLFCQESSSASTVVFDLTVHFILLYGVKGGGGAPHHLICMTVQHLRFGTNTVIFRSLILYICTCCRCRCIIKPNNHRWVLYWAWGRKIPTEFRHLL